MRNISINGYTKYMKDSFSDTVDAVGDKANEMKDTISNNFHNSKLGEIADNVKDNLDKPINSSNTRMEGSSAERMYDKSVDKLGKEEADKKWQKDSTSALKTAGAIGAVIGGGALAAETAIGKTIGKIAGSIGKKAVKSVGRTIQDTFTKGDRGSDTTDNSNNNQEQSLSPLYDESQDNNQYGDITKNILDKYRMQNYE